MALDPARPETALLLAAMEEVEARTRGRDHAEHDPQPRAVVGAERHASLAVAAMRDAMRVDAHRPAPPPRCDRLHQAHPPDRTTVHSVHTVAVRLHLSRRRPIK